MTSLFLTLTSDEVSDTKFPEVKTMDEYFLSEIYNIEDQHKFRVTQLQHDNVQNSQSLCTSDSSSFSLQHAPVENTRMFHHRCMNFMEKHILTPGGLLHNVSDYVIRYECQHRGYAVITFLTYFAFPLHASSHHTSLPMQISPCPYHVVDGHTQP